MALHHKQYYTAHTVKKALLHGKKLQGMIWLGFSKQDALSIKWQHSSEFIYLSQMYDVADSLIRSDSVFYFCYPDRIETAQRRYLTGIAQQILGSMPHHQKQHTNLKIFFINLSMPEPIAILPEKGFRNLPTGSFFYDTFHSNYWATPVSPPPEFDV